MSFALLILAVALSCALTAVSPLRADTISLSVADYQNDFDPNIFPTGWRYLWNAPVDFNTPTTDGTTNPIGNSANYSELLPTGTGVWTADGNAYGFSGPPVSQFLHLGADEGHPGRGALQNEGVGNNLDRFAIAEYTVTTPGTYYITDSTYGPGNFGSAGRQVQVYVNNTLVLDQLNGGTETASFNTGLGALSAGDRVYVAFGPDGSDTSDGFVFNYAIDKVIDNAVVVAGYRNDFDPNVFPTGWRYLWNAPVDFNTPTTDGTTNPIGNSANYSELLPTGTGVWTADGNAYGFSGPPVSQFLHFGADEGHPGRGALQSEGVGNNLDRFAIAEYTVDLSGYYVLFDSLYGPGNLGSAGREVQLYVNDLLLLDLTGDGFLNFDFDFGLLHAGDHIYVALGPDQSDTSDGFVLDFKIARYGLAEIAQAPEPATLAILGLGLAGLGLKRRGRAA